MPNSLSSDPAKFLETLSLAIRRRMTIKEASRVAGYATPKQLYNRLEGKTPFPIGEILHVVAQLDLDLHQLLVQAGLQRPSLLDPAALLRHFTPDQKPFDHELSRFLQEAPEPIQHAAEAQMPERYFELDELRWIDSERFSQELSAWFRETHFAASLSPSPQSIVSYCCALDLKAAYLANMGKLRDASIALAHALDLNQSTSVSSLYLLQTAAAILRRLGGTRIALALAKLAHSEAALTDDRLLEARCLLTIASIYVIFDEEELLQRAERAYQRIQTLTPQHQLALASTIYLAYLRASKGQESQAIVDLESLSWERLARVPTLAFRWLWIRGRAAGKVGDKADATRFLLRALDTHPHEQDPVNLLLVLDSLRRLNTLSNRQLAEAASRLRPYFSAADFRIRAVSEVAAKVLTALENRVRAPEVDALMEQVQEVLGGNP